MTDDDVGRVLAGLTPMLAKIGEVRLDSLAGTHVFDTKLDGIRALVAWDGRTLTIRSRTGQILTPSFPELREAARALGHRALILDGEIAAESGSFQQTMRRYHATRPLDVTVARKAVPVRFHAFDVLWQDTDLRGLPYRDRRDVLDHLSLTGPWIASLVSTNPKAFEAVKALGGEGVIAKSLTARYMPGRSGSWLKYKAKYSVTVVAVGYEPGTGSRAAIGAIALATVAQGTVRRVGHVGAGFTMTEVMRIKHQLDAAARGNGPLPVIEVECMGLTRERKLRQPVYKGLRSDLTIHDALDSQLDALPIA